MNSYEELIKTKGALDILRKCPNNPPLEGSVLQIIAVNYTDKEITITALNSNLPDISDYKLILA